MYCLVILISEFWPKVKLHKLHFSAKTNELLNQRRSHTQFFGSQNPPFNQNDVHFPEYLDDSSITKQAEIKAHDKRAIVSHFLHNDSVFTHLCKVMFGAEDGEDSNDTFVQQRNDIT